jgi:hypothetical protein
MTEAIVMDGGKRGQLVRAPNRPAAFTTPTFATANRPRAETDRKKSAQSLFGIGYSVRYWMRKQASDLLKSCEARRMRSYTVSSRINNVAYDDGKCSVCMEPADNQARLFIVLGMNSGGRAQLAGESISRSFPRAGGNA